MGNITLFQELDSTPERNALELCYLAKHPDARRWLPGPREPHIVRWTVAFIGCEAELIIACLGILGAIRPTGS